MGDNTTMTTDDGPAVLYSHDDGVARITFNRPARLNALSEAVADGFAYGIERAFADNVAVVIVAGTGRGFMAGGDLTRLVNADAASGDGLKIGPIHAFLERMAAAPFITIAALHGPVAGAGLSFAMNTDLAVAADNARITMAYARIGVSPDCGGTYALPRLVGLRRAMEVALFADDITAVEAERIGLVNRVVPLDALDDTVTKMARRIAGGPREALARTKALLRQSLDTPLPGQLAAEEVSFRACVATADFKEGATAFLEKRRPEFGKR